MLLGKLCERKDKTALMYMHSTLVLLFETRKLIHRTTRIILPRQLTPICPFICGKTYRICNFLANCCDYARKQYKTPISFSPEVYETSSKTGFTDGPYSSAKCLSLPHHFLSDNTDIFLNRVSIK